MIGHPAPLTRGESETSNHDRCGESERWLGRTKFLTGRLQASFCGGESDLPTRAKWRALSRSGRLAPKKRLTPPALLERRFHNSYECQGTCPVSRRHVQV